MKTQFMERTHSTSLRVRPEFIEGRSDISLLAEFDPPPLLETTVRAKMVGLKRR